MSDTDRLVRQTARLDTGRLLEAMRRTLKIERDGLQQLEASLDESAVAVVSVLATLKGRLICAGVGKSGHVARKIAATLASTGTPAQYVHPSEASHGDLGMITAGDAVLALSKSGETRELGDLTAYCRRFGVPLIALTAGRDSALAKAADHVLLIPNAPEAAGETRAPTTSTTLMMAYGDALAVALIEARGFTAADFATFHPGGTLGAAFLKARDLMHTDAPLASEGTLMAEALITISAKGFGCIGVTSPAGALNGIITDGDLRRHMAADLTARTVESVMTPSPITIGPDALAADALRQMTAGERKILALFVCDEASKPLGILHIHDLLRAGLS
ncbi:MAG: KpsF/GutQ family sugar-phosphate isomerase [Oceanicaulis sp.]|uniref:KpsF/GutQ family sugar-phosphate isomerase n=1 Tax=Glycocaulis sp. TaxID=1969725 RepID=UPI0025BB52BA|nr:KpsF/GutQ family sugar-phosphate isomerase [Glycocaulis sp.]MCC5981430.1 KpsF/GutQ family sugar-phosphate isomerase [Oceanicaulis sp.]MCH8521744.1 KpsF/GutQ family sugar-phosphate isomerase [Glycocaulis sp.]